MENNNNVFTLDKGKVEYDIINTDNLKKILMDPHNNTRLRDAVVNEVKDLQTNIDGLTVNEQNEYLTKANDIFSKYSKLEKISSYKLIEEISKISSPKVQEIVEKVEIKKVETEEIVDNVAQVKQDDGFSFKKAIAGFIDKGVKSSPLGNKLSSNANKSLDQYEKVALANID